MWVRRLGVPPLWPSRIKIFVTALLISNGISQVGTYLLSANVEFLNLSPGGSGTNFVKCIEPFSDCKGYDHPLDCMVAESQEKWFGMRLSNDTWPMQCKAMPTAKARCQSVKTTLEFSQSDLGKLHTFVRWVNPFRVWGRLFTIFGWAMSLLVMFHDLVLLQEKWRPKVLSLLTTKQAFPRAWHLQQRIRCSHSLKELHNTRPVCWIILLPLAYLWQVVVFLAFVYPMFVLLYLFNPIRMSRFAVFTSALVFAIYSIVYLCMTIRWGLREHWAVFFNGDDVADWEEDVHCLCYCEYPLATGTIQRLVTFGIIALYVSLSILMRTLKGLRQQRWAMLLSVLYTVPIEVFPVRWERPAEAGGGPIKFRKEGEDVQGEPAFDPFALMDEQPESWRSRLHIESIQEPAEKVRGTKWASIHVTDKDVHCCGFPRFHVPQNEEDEEEVQRTQVCGSDGDDVEDSTEDDSGSGSGDEETIEILVQEEDTRRGTRRLLG